MPSFDAVLDTPVTIETDPLQKIIFEIKEKIYDQPDSSPFRYDRGWNDALNKAIEIIERNKTA